MKRTFVTETIAHLYEELGADCIERLDGMFAIAIWDEPRRRLVLARDRTGMKPLYYHVDGRRVLLEIVGFWTPEYLAAKVALLRQLPANQRWVFCVDRGLAAAFETTPTHGPLLLFRRRIPVAELFAFVERVCVEQLCCPQSAPSL